MSRKTLQPLVDEYLRGRVKRGELTKLTAFDSYRPHLRRFAESFGARPLSRLGPAAVDHWLESIGGHAPASRRAYISIIRCFCQWLVSTKRIAADPTSHVRPVKEPRHVPRTLNEVEVGRLLDVCTSTRSRAVIWLMVGCGLRCVEVSRLDLADYDRDQQLLTVTGKGGHERQVPVPALVGAALDAYLDEAGRVRGPLLRNEIDGRSRLAPKTLSGYVRGWLRTCGVKSAALDGRSAHALRRTAGSDVMERSGQLRVVQEMLGHARLETTARYYLRPVPIGTIRDAMEGRSYGQTPVEPVNDELAARRARVTA